jgi:multidrug efflux system membrane fusion protein
LTASSAASADPRPVPVTTGVVEIQDFPIYRIGVGTVQAYNTVTVRVRVDGEIQPIAFREGQDVPAISLRKLIRARRRLSCIRRRPVRQGMRPLLANAELDLERYSSLAAKEFASRQSVDTQKALVAQYQAAIQRDEAAIDNAGVSLGYTTITSPINGRTGVRLVDLGNIVHASDSTGLVVVAQLDPIFVIFTLPQDNLPEITEAMRQGALTSRMTRITVSSLARGASRSSTTRSTRATAHFD